MYTTSRLSTIGCDNVDTHVYHSQTLDNTPEISLRITGVVAGVNTHIVSETAITLTLDQWRDVVYKINENLKEIGYANETRV